MLKWLHEREIPLTVYSYECVHIYISFFFFLTNLGCALNFHEHNAAFMTKWEMGSFQLPSWERSVWTALQLVIPTRNVFRDELRVAILWRRFDVAFVEKRLFLYFEISEILKGEKTNKKTTPAQNNRNPHALIVMVITETVMVHVGLYWSFVFYSWHIYV